MHWAASKSCGIFSAMTENCSSRELLLQGWMKPGRDDLAPNVALVSKRFNEVEDLLRRIVGIQSCCFVDVSTSHYRNSDTANGQWSNSMY